MLNYSPVYMLQTVLMEDEGHIPDGWEAMLPNVSRWSDVVWILWKYMAGAERAHTLKYIFRHEVATKFTRQVMALCVGGVDPETGHLPRWPGRTFRLGSDEFQAVLGTPHSRSIVYLLTQHPRELPFISIDSITIFSVTSMNDFQLLFTLTG